MFLLSYFNIYFSGNKTHVEFVCSAIPFDIERRQAGIPDYQNVPWESNAARRSLRLAQPIFPAIAGWSTSVVDGNYSPTIKLSVALQGG